MDNSLFSILYPRSTFLQKYIDYYYFLGPQAGDINSSYYSFPNVNYSLNIHKNAACVINGHSIAVNGHARHNNFLCILQGKFSTPLQVTLQGMFDKITIAFKPSGLNHFIQPPLGSIAANPSQVFTAWQNVPHFTAMLQQFYATQHLEERVTLLEGFLLGQYRTVEHEEIMCKAITLLTNPAHTSGIGCIASQLALTERTFNRLFYKHFAVSPVTYRQIARFRNSIKQSDIYKLQSLTSIGYQHNFYDQAHFIKTYRKITGTSPSQFYNTLTRLADGRLLFKFLNG